MKLPDRIVIATRESRLALWQAHFVRDALARRYPSCRVEILGMTTRGDQVLDESLAKIGGKGLFVRELEVALADGRADIAVHSAKDVPMELAGDFRLATILAREDARDCLVSSRYARLQELPAGAVVGTSSLRREAQLRERHAKIEIRPLRGNLDTRLAKLDRGDFDAIVLASAGLKRLGLGSRIRAMLEPEESLPAPGQGALAIECRRDHADLVNWLSPLGDAATAACVRAERAVSRSLSGSCQLPLGAYGEARGGEIVLRALVATADGARVIRAEARGDAEYPEALGEQLAQALRAKGADAILAALDAS